MPRSVDGGCSGAKRACRVLFGLSDRFAKNRYTLSGVPVISAMEPTEKEAALHGACFGWLDGAPD
jgi:galactose mutarotase-like enzyme